MDEPQKKLLKSLIDAEEYERAKEILDSFASPKKSLKSSLAEKLNDAFSHIEDFLFRWHENYLLKKLEKKEQKYNHLREKYLRAKVKIESLEKRIDNYTLCPVWEEVHVPSGKIQNRSFAERHPRIAGGLVGLLLGLGGGTMPYTFPAHLSIAQSLTLGGIGGTLSGISFNWGKISDYVNLLAFKVSSLVGSIVSIFLLTNVGYQFTSWFVDNYLINSIGGIICGAGYGVVSGLYIESKLG